MRGNNTLEPLLPTIDAGGSLRRAKNSNQGRLSNPRNRDAQESFLGRQLGTDLQRCMLCWFFASLPQLWLTGNHHKHQQIVHAIGRAASLLSAILQTVSNALFFYYVAPKRVLKASYYELGKRRSPPPGFISHNFGTPMLVASQIQVMAYMLFVVAGLLQVAYVDLGALESEGFWGFFKAKDEIGCMNIVTGICGAFATWWLNWSMYPEYDYQKLSGCTKRFSFSGNFQLAWVISMDFVMWLISALVSSESLLSPGFYLFGALWFLRSCYKEHLFVAKIFSGCHTRTVFPTEHPMGALFNTRDAKVDRQGILSALKVQDLPWRLVGGSTWFWDRMHYTGMKKQIIIDLPAFVVAEVFKSVDVKRLDPGVQAVEVLEHLHEPAAEVVYVSRRAADGMPESDEVILSIMRWYEHEVAVLEWAVCHHTKPAQDYVARNYPFMVYLCRATTCAATEVTVYVITWVPPWMALALVHEGFTQAAADLDEIARELPGKVSGEVGSLGMAAVKLQSIFSFVTGL